MRISSSLVEMTQGRKSSLFTYFRTAQVAIPATSSGQKVPVVFHLHGNFIILVNNQHRTTLKLILQEMEVRVTPYRLEVSLVMTVSLWLLMAMREVGKN